MDRQTSAAIGEFLLPPFRQLLMEQPSEISAGDDDEDKDVEGRSNSVTSDSEQRVPAGKRELEDPTVEGHRKPSKRRRRRRKHSTAESRNPDVDKPSIQQLTESVEKSAEKSAQLERVSPTSSRPEVRILASQNSR